MIPLTLFEIVKSIPGIEWLKQQLIQLKLYEARLGELKGAVDVLKKELELVINRVNEVESQPGKVRAAKVRDWIDGVNVIIPEYNEFIEDRCLDELAVLQIFTTGYLPKPGIRYCRSRRAYSIITKVNEKLNTAKFDEYAEWSGPPSKAAFLLNDNYENFPSRAEIVKKLKAALGNPNVKMIGLYGLKGVGKSTMVKEVAKEVEANKDFVMTMANLEGNPGIRQIQGEIGGWLGITLVEESDSARAAQIEDHLKKKNALVILDHLCDKLDFKLLGIPSLNGNLNNVDKGKSPVQHSMVEIEETLPDCYKMCKVLLISESKQLLLSQMGGKENNIFTMDVLKDEEAEVFFKKTAEIGDGESEFNILAAQIAKKCNGLPSSVIESAKGLVDQKSHSAWTNALQSLELKMSTGVPEFSTKLSYELLEDEELKKIFLLCAYVGPDVLIMDLVKHCIGLDYLQGTYKVRDARDKVCELVRKLKLFGLLSDNHSSDHVTMQGIVRSAALSIASDTEEKHIFTMTKKPFQKWPDEDKLERLAVISLRHCDDIFKGSLKRINCPRLRVFHVDNNDPLLEIPTNFFEGMKELRVLILTGIHLSPSDSSIASLNKLRMLCLEQCILDKDLSFIGNLKELRILSFSGSDIEKLPVELKQLKNLQVFDISNCFKLREIPPNVISSLTDLEELYMRNTFIQWKPIGETHPDGIACLSEFRRLIQNQLTTLDLQIPVVSCVPNDLLFYKLERYKIVGGKLSFALLPLNLNAASS